MILRTSGAKFLADATSRFRIANSGVGPTRSSPRAAVLGRKKRPSSNRSVNKHAPGRHAKLPSKDDREVRESKTDARAAVPPEPAMTSSQSPSSSLCASRPTTPARRLETQLWEYLKSADKPHTVPPLCVAIEDDPSSIRGHDFDPATAGVWSSLRCVRRDVRT